MINDQFTFSSKYFQACEFPYKEVIELVWKFCELNSTGIIQLLPSKKVGKLSDLVRINRFLKKGSERAIY